MRNSQEGFTLLEVLIALTLLAVMSAGFLGSMNVTIKQQQSLEEKTIALWVAKNYLAKLHAEHGLLDIGNSKQNAVMAGRSWLLEITSANTANPQIRKITVNVSDVTRQNPKSVAVSLDGYAGKI